MYTGEKCSELITSDGAARALWAVCYVCHQSPMAMLGMVLIYLQLGQASVNPPDLCLKWGAGSHAWKAEVPPQLLWSNELPSHKKIEN